MTIHLCTYADRHYLGKLLCLIESLRRHQADFRLYILALDGVTLEALSWLYGSYSRVTVAPLRVIETDELREARRARSWREYIFTLTPAWALYVLKRHAPAGLAYLDADCYVFGDLAPLYAEVAAASIGVIPHHWTPRHATRLRPNGIFNVGWVYWRNDRSGLSCLRGWERECLGWRGSRGQFSVQVFLDQWPAAFVEQLHSVTHCGANLAPWNQEQYRYQWDRGRLWVEHGHSDDMGIGVTEYDPLLFYHFHEFREQGGGFYRTGYPVHPIVAEHVYAPYEAEMRTQLQRLREMGIVDDHVHA